MSLTAWLLVNPTQLFPGLWPTWHTILSLPKEVKSRMDTPVCVGVGVCRICAAWAQSPQAHLAFLAKIPSSS